MNKTSITKKILCVVLALAVLAVSVPFTALAAPQDKVNFVILSDLHYYAEDAMGTTPEDKQEFAELMLLNNATTFLAPALTEAAMANVTAMALNDEIDFLLIPGDLTKNAEKAAHIELASRFEQFEQTTGVPVYVIDGNHDINNDRANQYNGTELVAAEDVSPEEFASIYANFGYSAEGGYYSRYKEAGNSEGSLSYATDLPGNYRLIAIDSQMYSADNTDAGLDEQETAGIVSPAHLEWVLNECAKAESDGKTIIGMIHTNTIPHFETEVDLFDNFVLRGWEKFADAVADAGMHLTVSGHVHMQDVASYVNDNGETITDITTTSLLSYPNMFRSVSMETALNGDITVDYKSHDVDEYVPVMYNGVTQPVPFKYETWKYNFGGDNIKNFVMNMLEYQLNYGFGKDIEEAGGLYNYLDEMVGMRNILNGVTGSDFLDGLTNVAINTLVYSLCQQLERAYLKDPQATMDKLSPMLDKLLDIKVSDYPSTKFASTLGFTSKYEYGTVGDLASTVLAYHYTNDEFPHDDKMLMSALDRFYNGENAENLVNVLFDVLLNDLIQDTILKDIKIDAVSLGATFVPSDILDDLSAMLEGFMQTGWEGFGVGDLVSIILMTGIVGGDNLSDVVYSLLDEYLTQSQYDIIDGEFYRVMTDFTHDFNPTELADFNGTFKYTGKVEVPLTQSNLRIPSHIAVTFGENSETDRNFSYVTKYSVTNTDIQIVPCGDEVPDFSKGSTVDFDVETNCEVDAQRSYSSIDLGFIGLLKAELEVNRHTIKVSGLEEGKKYYYRIGDAEKGWWSLPGIIETGDNGTTFNFLHVTDPQSVTEKQYSDNWATLLHFAQSEHNADFIINTGDLVDNGGDFKQWQKMFNLASLDLVNVPMQTASGNHEEKGDYANIENFLYANLPEQDTTTGVYYSFDYNTAHVAILNTNNLNEDGTLSNDQLEWLKADMAGSSKSWKFVALHKAPYSNGSHFDDDDVSALRTQLSTLMPELDVDIVFQGHDHVFMRTDVMNNNAIVPTETKELTYNGLTYTSKIQPEGTIYSINGTAGSKHYEPKPAEETAEAFPAGETVLYLEVPSYSHIQIDGGNLYFDSYTVTNGGALTRVDQFAISKVITLEDGTVIDGTNDNKVELPDNDNSGDDNDSNDGVMGDIADTFRKNYGAKFMTVAGGALFVIAVIVTTTVVIKRRREEA